MLIIIWSNKNNKTFLEAKKYEKILFLNKICDLKQIKEKKNILLIDGTLLTDDGIIKDYNYFLEEVFISIFWNTAVATWSATKVPTAPEFTIITAFSILILL